LLQKRLDPMNELIRFILQEKNFVKDIVIISIKYSKLQIFWKANDIFINIFLKVKAYFIFSLFDKIWVQVFRKLKLFLEFINQIDLFLLIGLVLILTLYNRQNLTTDNWKCDNSDYHYHNTNNPFKSISSTYITISDCSHCSHREIKCSCVLLVVCCLI
jgi:hypothetical protein